ncbi:MAG: nucleotide exchange factor GrpE [Acidobacteria bacterium RIFCSPLOWO2_02_FULL_65_29]|nr:MAG: nucleotide exchange factor GrpE [Acidobacteria bacterium RIFCSPLOWO2_02_FULL_65_29]
MSDEHVSEPAAEAPAATDPGGAADGPSAGAVALGRERDELHDRLLRKTAEFDNYRKRIERERREQADQAVVNLVQDLLLVVDDFDRALTVDAPDGAAAYRKGVEIIHAKLNDLLKRYGVRPFDSLGADFDPNLHQAVVHEASPAHRAGEVIGELGRGYMMGDRLLRPAMVKVAKA